MRKSLIACAAVIVAGCAQGKSLTDPTSLDTTLGVGNSETVVMTLAPASVAGNIGDTVRVATTLKDSKGNSVYASSMTWTSADTSVATVSASGVVHLKKGGSTVVTVSGGGASATDSVTVQKSKTSPTPTPTTTTPAPPTVSAVHVTPATSTILKGQTAQFSATVVDSTGAAISGQTVTWSSSNQTIATVSATGLATAMAAGSAVITATSGSKSATVSVTVTQPAPPPAPVASATGEQAVWSDAFVNSIGTNVHLDYTSQPYVTAFSTIVLPRLQEIGIRHLRTSLVATSNDGWMRAYYSRVNALHNQLGITYDVLTWPAGAAQWGVPHDYTNVPLDRAFQFFDPSGIETVEGLNELDYASKDSNWAVDMKTWQQALDDSARTNANLAGHPVIGPSIVHQSSPLVIGSLTSWEDLGNTHSYQGGKHPGPELAYQENFLFPSNGTKPYAATETGYHTAVHATSGQPGVSELAMGKYLPRLFFEYFNSGIIRTYTYELMDEGTDLTNPEASFGMLHYDGSPKPAFTALKNLIGLLNDRGTSYSPGKLNYSLTGASSAVHHTLLQKQNGKFYLMLWQEVSSFNLTTKTDITVAAQTVTLTLPASAHEVRTFLPLQGATATSDVSSVSSVQLSVSDQVLVVEITP